MLKDAASASLRVRFGYLLRSAGCARFRGANVRFRPKYAHGQQRAATILAEIDMDALDPVIEITASCNFADPFPSGLAEVRDWSRPILRVAGRYFFVCAVRVAGAPVRAGDKREIIIRAIDDGGLVRAVEETRSVALMAGPRFVVAHGDVPSFQVVRT